MFSGFLLIPQIAQAPDVDVVRPRARRSRRRACCCARARSASSRRARSPGGSGSASASGDARHRVAAQRRGLRLLAVLHDAWWHLALGGLLLGAGVAFAFASMANLIVAAVEQSEVGIATGSTP
jgi:hypothetical protein